MKRQSTYTWRDIDRVLTLWIRDIWQHRDRAIGIDLYNIKLDLADQRKKRLARQRRAVAKRGER